jgi:hypothetical protein
MQLFFLSQVKPSDVALFGPSLGRPAEATQFSLSSFMKVSLDTFYYPFLVLASASALPLNP